jgi:hypothetical protein
MVEQVWYCEQKLPRYFWAFSVVIGRQREREGFLNKEKDEEKGGMAMVALIMGKWATTIIDNRNTRLLALSQSTGDVCCSGEWLLMMMMRECVTTPPSALFDICFFCFFPNM